MSHFEVFQDATDEDWRFRLVASNGEIVADGEGYTRKEDAERGVRDVTSAVLHSITKAEPEIRDGEAP